MAIKGEILKPSPWSNDLFRGTCRFADDINNVRWMDDRAYTDVLWLRDLLKDKYRQAFDLTPD